MSRHYLVPALLCLWLISLILFFMFNKSLGEGIALNNVKNNETSQSLERMKKRIDDIQLAQSEILTLLTSLSQKTDIIIDTKNNNNAAALSNQPTLEKIKADDFEQPSGIQGPDFDIAAFTEKYTNSHSFDDQLMMEVVDVQWTNEVRNRVTAVLNNKLISGTEMLNTECKSTLCKFEFTHKDTESAQLFNQFFQKKLRWLGESQRSSVVRANGDIETKLYLLRKK